MILTTFCASRLVTFAALCFRAFAHTGTAAISKIATISFGPIRTSHLGRVLRPAPLDFWSHQGVAMTWAGIEPGQLCPKRLGGSFARLDPRHRRATTMSESLANCAVALHGSFFF